MAGRGVSTQAIETTGRRQALARWCHRTGILPLMQRLRSASRHDLRVLAYHRVLESAEPADFTFDTELISASAEGFREQMLFLRKHFQPMRFDEVLDCADQGRPLPEGAVLVTFDDGYDDNHRVAFPILRELGMSAMFFVSTGHIDSGLPYAYDWLVHMVCMAPVARLQLPELGLDWKLGATLAERRAQASELLDRLKALDDDGQGRLIARLEQAWGMPREHGHPDCRPMSWGQVREMHRAGMEIGSHGVGHRMLAKLPLEQMTEEVVGSKKALERELGVAPGVLSYPVGGPDAFDLETIDTVRNAGFRLACSYMAGTGKVGPATRYSLPRLPVERQMDRAWFEAMVTVPEVFSYASRLRT